METDWATVFRRLRGGVASARELHRCFMRLKQDLVAKELLIGRSRGDRARELRLYIRELTALTDDLLKVADWMIQRESEADFEGFGKDIAIENVIIRQLQRWEYRTLRDERREGGSETWWADVRGAIGFEDDEDKIVNMLLDTCNDRCVISAVGMGGPGKTALLFKVLTNGHVRSYFECCALVSLCQTHSTQFVLDDIRRQVMWQADRRTLPTFLTQNRYLVVLDEVWEPIINILDSLPDVGNGSRVLITTQHMNVAAFAGPSAQAYHLHLLSEDETWDLFKKLFPDTAKACNKKLRRWIVEEYGNLPLSLRAVGRALQNDRFSPRHTMSWPIPIDDDTYYTLILSYKHLGSTPRRLCFFYLTCMIPKGVEIEAEKLVCLWVAEGFLDAIEKVQDSDVEETARRVLESLRQSGMIRVEERFSYSGGSMAMVSSTHPIMRDAYIPVANEAGFCDICTHASSPIPKEARRLTLHPYSSKDYVSNKFPTPSLQTLVGFGLELDKNSKSLHSIEALQLLRVLELENTRLTSIPNEIGKLIHLKYLGLRRTLLKSIPSSIGNLHNLQTLDVRITFIEQLPLGLWKIKSMRHIFFDPIVKLQGIGTQLTNLQTLKALSAEEWKTNSHSLSHMTNLRTLAIRLMRKDHHSAIVDSLSKLSVLQDLYLAADYVPRDLITQNNCGHLRVLSLLGKHQVDAPFINWELLRNLEELNLYCSGLRHDPLPSLERLPRLKCLRLHSAYIGEKLACNDHGFHSLERLYLASLPIKHWDIQGNAMPFLKDLTIKACNNLEELPDKLPKMTTLQSLELLRISDSFKEHVQKGGRDWCKIKHIPSIRITEANIK